MRAQKTESELRQQQIVEAALELIGSEGINALTIAGIAARVGIVPSALYRHFKGKDEVLDAVLELLQFRLADSVSRVREETKGALPRLQSLLMRHARMLSENRAIPHVVFSDGLYTGRPERKAKVGGIILGFLKKIEQILEEGQQEGAIRDDVVPATAAVMFLGMILPAAVLRNVTEGRFDMIANAENAWPVFVRCIATEG